MRVHKLTVGFVSLGLLAGGAIWAIAPQGHAAQQPQAKAHDDGDADDTEQVIPLDQAPEAVRAAAIRLVGDVRDITAVIREEDHEDVITYEIEFNQGATKCSVNLSASGDVLERETATSPESIPAAALAALRKLYPGATVTDPHLVTRTYYEVSVVVGGRKHEIKVDAAGIIEDDQDADDDGHDNED